MEAGRYTEALPYWAERYANLPPEEPAEERFFIAWQYGDCLGECGQPARAVALFREAEQMAIADLPAEDRLLLRAAICYHALEADMHDLSDRYFDANVAAWRAAGHTDLLYNLAHLRLHSNHEAAFDTMRIVLETAEEQGDTETLGYAYQTYAIFLLRSRAFDQALSLSQRLAGKLVDPDFQLLAALNELEVYYQRGQTRSFRKHWQKIRAQGWFERQGLDPVLAAQLRLAAAIFALQEDRLDEAEAHMQAGIKEVDDEIRETLLHTSRCYQAWVNFYHNERALPYYERALDLAAQLADPPTEWDIKVDYAIALYNLNRFAEVVELLEPILQPIRADGDWELLRRAIANLTRAAYSGGFSACHERTLAQWLALEDELPESEHFDYYFELGNSLCGIYQVELGYQLLLKARKNLAKEAHRHHGPAVEKALATAAFQMDRNQLALTHLDRVDPAAEDQNFQADYWLVRGNVLGELDQLEAAQTCYETAIALCGQRPDFEHHLSPAYCNLGLLHHGQGRFAEAEKYYQLGYAIDQRHQNASYLSVSLHNLGSLALDRGQYRTAEKYLRQTLEWIGRRYADNFRTDRRKYTSDNWTNTAEMLAEAWARLGRVGDAFRLIVYWQKLQSGLPLTELREQPLPRLTSTECLLCFAGIRRERLLLFWQIGSSIDWLAIDLRNYEVTDRDLLDKIEAYTEKLEQRDHQRRIRRFRTYWPDLLRYHHHRRQRPERYKSYRSKTIDRRLGQWVYGVLLRPVLQQLPDSITRLIILPDFLIGQTPLAILPTDSGEYLVDRYELTYFGGMRPEPVAASALSSLLIGATHYPASVVGHPSLPELTAGQAEAEGLRTVLPDLSDELNRTTAEDLERRGRNGSLATYRYIHCIAHADLDNQGEARLHLYDAAHRRISELRASSIAAWEIRADLVFLSACSTGTGTAFAGWGIDSIGQAFLTAGARSVITSLWPVADQATTHLSTLFYQLIADRPFAEALATLQRRCRTGQLGEHLREVYYWGGWCYWEQR